MKGQELLDEVFGRINLRERDYFGLRFMDHCEEAVSCKGEEGRERRGEERRGEERRGEERRGEERRGEERRGEERRGEDVLLVILITSSNINAWSYFVLFRDGWTRKNLS